eukprot:CAMPEP_0206299840 /NCGR_PEP_ID=MMETSP0106_2-20121207/7393_1 /ASSEMBLY_ACC=CAM_ASM_000206 /TAXON_ID=81532 /ORGANISM="Acanthoeca-like sp., Strain 10tr" /LENGTH=66 /DNA_ID=CAMNT_0053730545 /DNA_START=532 /DNA_END=732 /DNA_ORIENTATION=-
MITSSDPEVASVEVDAAVRSTDGSSVGAADGAAVTGRLDGDDVGVDVGLHVPVFAGFPLLTAQAQA